MPVTVWAARLDRALTESETAVLTALLPPERRVRLLRLQQRGRREPLCAYGLLWLALADRCGWQELPEIALSPRGKPGFPNYPNVQFSLSHTEGAVLVGISDTPIGVDIERLRPVSHRMLAGWDSEEAFFQNWVRREAIVKRGGAGIAAAIHTEAALKPEEAYYPLKTFSGYAAGAAADRRETLRPVRRLTQDELLSKL